MKKIKIDDISGISMSNFLLNYANLDGNITVEQVTKFENDKLTHQDITELGIPYLKRVPEDIITEDDLAVGNIIIVNDFKGKKGNKRSAPYLRPSIVKEMEEEKKRRQEYGKNNKRLERRIRNGKF